MIQDIQAPPAGVQRELTLSDLRAALIAGWDDFRARPAFGLFFGGIYVVSGIFLYYALLVYGQVIWLVPAAAGFPLLAPFTAVGLYEVSRRREAGLPIGWGAVLGALRGRGDEQLVMMGGILFVGFSFWIGIAHGIFAIFMAESGIGAESVGLLGTSQGIAMLLVGGMVGAIIAFGFYVVTVISLPMLVDRNVDFITAVIASVSTFRGSKAVMLIWAAMIALGLTVAMLPLFLGLLVVLPVLGHATWHLYKRTGV